MRVVDFSSSHRLLAFFLAALAWVTPALSWAQNAFPNRPITVVIPFGPGGETDIFARSLSAELGEVLGQPIVVVNKPVATCCLRRTCAITAMPIAVIPTHIGWTS